MSRLWIMLALALSLWPSAAAASPGAPDPGGDVLTPASSRYADGVLRPAGGLELLLTGPGREDDRLDGSGGSADRLRGRDRVPSRVRLLRRAPSAEAANPATPLCERLPYHATAPPSPR